MSTYSQYKSGTSYEDILIGVENSYDNCTEIRTYQNIRTGRIHKEAIPRNQYYKMACDMADAQAYSTYTMGEWPMESTKPKHTCLVKPPEERHKDFQNGILNFYELQHPELVEKIKKETGCNNINCLIENIKKQI